MVLLYGQVALNCGLFVLYTWYNHLTVNSNYENQKSEVKNSDLKNPGNQGV